MQLFGAPIGSAAFGQNFSSGVLSKLKAIDEALLGLDDAQIEFCLFRSCLGNVKIAHLLRVCNPATMGGVCAAFDERARSVLTRIIRDTAIPDMSWTQATLPSRLGGTAITSAEIIKTAAFIASSVMTEQRVSELIQWDLANLDRSYSTDALLIHNAAWGSEHTLLSLSTKSKHPSDIE